MGILPNQEEVIQMKNIFRSALLCAALSGSMATAVSAEEWRLNNFLPETRPESAQIEQFANDVNAALTDKDFKLTVYGGGSLGILRPMFRRGCTFHALATSTSPITPSRNI